MSKQIKKIGIFLPHFYRGGTLNGAKNIAKMIHLSSRHFNDPITVVFSCLKNFYDFDKDFKDILSLGIKVYGTTWQQQHKNELKLVNSSFSLIDDYYLVPVDTYHQFYDCDFWLMISDRFSSPLAPIKPYGLVIYDYIQRYMPEVLPPDFNDEPYIVTARNANFVLTTTPGTRQDAIQYAGISPDRVHLAPMEFNPFAYQVPPSKIKEDYLIWTTNSTPHKNHLRAIQALEIYYGELNGSLKVVMTGELTEIFRPGRHLDEYSKEIGQLIEKSAICKKNLTVLGHLRTEEYLSVLAHAKFLWHPTLIDNGSFTVIEAAYYDVPALSHDYSQIRFIDDRFKLNLTFCDATSPRETAYKLKEMEENYTSLRQYLPSQEFLNQFNFMNIANEYWQLLRQLI